MSEHTELLTLILEAKFQESQATDAPWWYDENEQAFRLHGVAPGHRPEFGKPLNSQILKASKSHPEQESYWPTEDDARLLINSRNQYRALLDFVEAIAHAARDSRFIRGSVVIPKDVLAKEFDNVRKALDVNED